MSGGSDGGVLPVVICIKLFLSRFVRVCCGESAGLLVARSITSAHADQPTPGKYEKANTGTNF